MPQHLFSSWGSLPLEKRRPEDAEPAGSVATAQAQSQQSQMLGSQHRAATGSCVDLSLGSWETKVRGQGLSLVCVTSAAEQDQSCIWYIPALRRMGLEDHKSEASLGHTVRSP